MKNPDAPTRPEVPPGQMALNKAHLDALIKLKGLTRMSASIAAGLSSDYVNSLFRRKETKSGPQIEKLKLLCDVLGCEVSDLYRPDDAGVEPQESLSDTKHQPSHYTLRMGGILWFGFWKYQGEVFRDNAPPGIPPDGRFPGEDVCYIFDGSLVPLPAIAGDAVFAGVSYEEFLKVRPLHDRDIVVLKTTSSDRERVLMTIRTVHYSGTRMVLKSAWSEFKNYARDVEFPNGNTVGDGERHEIVAVLTRCVIDLTRK